MSFWPVLLLAIFILGGFTLKLADFFGEKGDNVRQYPPAVISAFTFGLLISESSYSSSIILGIIVGVTLSKKVNQVNLVLGLILSLLTALILGFQIPVLWLLAVISSFSLIDELCHDRFTEKMNRFRKFFNFRPILKIVMILMAAFSLIEVLYALAFLCFDLTYDATDWFLVKYESKSDLK